MCSVARAGAALHCLPVPVQRGIVLLGKPCCWKGRGFSCEGKLEWGFVHVCVCVCAICTVLEAATGIYQMQNEN